MIVPAGTLLPAVMEHCAPSDAVVVQLMMGLPAVHIEVVVEGVTANKLQTVLAGAHE